MKKHLKRLRVPEFWKLPKKSAKWATRPRAGPHSKFESIPLLIVVRDILDLADTQKDAKKIIKMGEVFVDGKHRKDHKYPAGLMDVVSISKIKADYRIVPTYKGLKLIEISAAEAAKKICKIENKRSLRKASSKAAANIQLNLHDGRNILIDAKDADKYEVGDSVLISLPDQKILDHLKMEKGALVIITKGKNIGMSGKIEEIIVTKAKEPTKIICKIAGEKMEVIKDYIFVIGKEKPVIKLTED